MPPGRCGRAPCFSLFLGCQNPLLPPVCECKNSLVFAWHGKLVSMCVCVMRDFPCFPAHAEDKGRLGASPEIRRTFHKVSWQDLRTSCAINSVDIRWKAASASKHTQRSPTYVDTSHRVALLETCRASVQKDQASEPRCIYIRGIFGGAFNEGNAQILQALPWTHGISNEPLHPVTPRIHSMQ